MSVKSQVLNFLEQNNDDSISGQEIAKKLSVSRCAVWKAINLLREDGYAIDAITNKGYCLAKENNLISAEGIAAKLDQRNKKVAIRTFNKLDSTNSTAKKLAVEGATTQTVIISDEQTAGRGRSGNFFFSPVGTGIYMSVILRPQATIANSQLVTIYTALAVCKAIEKTTAKAPKIKWVNDVFLNELKICGILTEAISDFESGNVESIIVGIGINVTTKAEDFPLELLNVAGSLSQNNMSRNTLIAAILDEMLLNQVMISKEELLTEYKKRSFIIGEDISFQKNDETIFAKAIDVNDNGNLVVELLSGERQTLFSGDVKIRRLCHGN